MFLLVIHSPMLSLNWVVLNLEANVKSQPVIDFGCGEKPWGGEAVTVSQSNRSKASTLLK